jgi:hypothetical protein
VDAAHARKRRKRCWSVCFYGSDAPPRSLTDGEDEKSQGTRNAVYSTSGEGEGQSLSQLPLALTTLTVIEQVRGADCLSERKNRGLVKPAKDQSS